MCYRISQDWWIKKKIVRLCDIGLVRISGPKKRIVRLCDLGIVRISGSKKKDRPRLLILDNPKIT